MRTSPLAYFIKAWRVAFLISIGLGLFGITTLLSLPRESTPEINIPFAAIITAYPGASARDVEELVTKELESAIETVEGIKEITSTSQPGISTISIEFEVDQDIDKGVEDLRTRIDQATDIPEDALEPRIQQFNFSSEPIISIAVGGIEDERLLSLHAKTIQSALQEIAGVAEVRIIGELPEEIRVMISPESLTRNNLTLNQVSNAIRASNINAPLGQIETEEFNYDLRVTSRFINVSDVASIPIQTRTGKVVSLDQIARIEQAVAKQTSRSRISIAGEESTAAVTLQVTKKAGGNIVNIVDEIFKRTEELQKNELPEDIVISTFANRAEDIRKSLSDVTQSGLQTLGIVLIILWLFLGWREALITATAIPLTFFIAFILFSAFGITLNSISLFSLILSLGLLVDTAIVVVEGIHSKKSSKDLPRHAAAVVTQFQKPLIGGTLTTVAAFFPMLLVSGIIGEFLSTIPIVISTTLLASLVVALALIPPVAVRALQNNSSQEDKQRWFDRQFDKVRDWYTGIVTKLLQSRSRQNKLIVILVILLAVGLSLPFTGLLKTGLFPEVDIDFMIMNIELPSGSNLAATSEVVSDIEKKLQTVPEISSYVANIGASSSIDLGGGSSSEHLASFNINLDERRKRTSIEITNALREEFASYQKASVTITEISAGPPTAPPVELKISGPDLDQLDELSLQIMEELNTISGAIDIDRNVRLSAGEFTFSFSEEKLAEYSLSIPEVSNTLRTLVFGSEVTTFLNSAGEETSVRILGEETSTKSISDLLALPLLTGQGEEIPLSKVASVQINSAFNTIRHRDTERTITITANANDQTTPNEISAELEKRVQALNLPKGYNFSLGGEQQETVETFNDLYRSMIVAVILILIILVVEFNSYLQPLLIFLSVPLALIGVLFGLLILGGQLNFASFIGLVSLVGIVVNNAIILVDYINKQIADGTPLLSATQAGVQSRLRPVILTTITTAAGVAPLIFVDEFFRDMALTLITGLLFSAVLTLIFIPILYVRQQQRLDAKMRRVNSD